jgi:CDP-paratose 2-epimerase
VKYLVTGGAGFIGCNAARRWMERGHDVVVLDDLSRRGADSNLAWLKTRGRFSFERVDIRDAAALDAPSPATATRRSSSTSPRRWRSPPR